jgi:hypothetical protein
MKETPQNFNNIVGCIAMSRVIHCLIRGEARNPPGDLDIMPNDHEYHGTE